MKKMTFRLLTIALIFTACSTAKNKTNQVILGQTTFPNAGVISHPPASATPTPSVVNTLPPGGVEFIPDPYYTTPEQRAFIAKAGKKMNEVVHSKCFYDFMSKRKMIQVNGKTSKQVADEFVAARGKIPVQVYYPRFRSSALAYRNPSDHIIHINGKVSDTWSYVCSLASIFVHESIGHSILEYDHDYEWSPSREYSAPYSANHAFDEEAYSGSESGACCQE